jgi:hypothetical protein
MFKKFQTGGARPSLNPPLGEEPCVVERRKTTWKERMQRSMCICRQQQDYQLLVKILFYSVFISVLLCALYVPCHVYCCLPCAVLCWSLLSFTFVVQFVFAKCNNSLE